VSADTGHQFIVSRQELQRLLDGHPGEDRFVISFEVVNAMAHLAMAPLREFPAMAEVER
jgi:hypothetical protein